MHVACEIPLDIMIVMGPKDSGKLERDRKNEKIVKKKWTSLDLNFKGKPQFITGNDAMNILSKEIMQ